MKIYPEPSKCASEPDEKVEVIYKFKLPDHRHELNTFSKADIYSSCLWDIYRVCRQVWKYEDDATEDKEKLAEQIGQMISETGVMEE